MDASLAALSAYGAAGALVLSGIAFALFLRRGVDSVWGPVNDVLTAVTALLLAPPMIAVLDLAADDAAGWFGIVTWLGIGGALLIAAGQLLLVARLLSLQGSFVTGGIGVLPFLAWMAAHAILAIGGGVALAPIVGWLAIGTLLGAVVLAATSRAGGVATWAVGAALLAFGAMWLLALGVGLRAASGG